MSKKPLICYQGLFTFSNLYGVVIIYDPFAICGRLRFLDLDSSYDQFRHQEGWISQFAFFSKKIHYNCVRNDNKYAGGENGSFNLHRTLKDIDYMLQCLTRFTYWYAEIIKTEIGRI